MGLLDILATGYLAKRALNKLNPPEISVPDGFQIVSKKPKGMSEYAIRYKKKGESSTSLMIIGRNTKSRSGGWEFYWD